MPLRRLSITLAAALLLAPAGAMAQSAVASGGTVRLKVYYAVDKDCTPSGKITFSMIRNPQHGRLDVRSTTALPRFMAPNPRVACNDRKVPAEAVFYKADAGFKGIDNLAYDVVFPAGRTWRQTLFVSVQ